MRREWVKQTMEAVRRGFCDRTERGKDRWVRVGAQKHGDFTGGLATAKSGNPIGAPRYQPTSDQLCLNRRETPA